MTPREAADLLNGVAFRPGWKIEARHREWLHHEVDLHVTLDTVDTSCPTPEGEYRTPHQFTVHRSLRVEPEDDQLDVLGRFLDAAHELDVHEDREFLRVFEDGRWAAPFHPHTPMGRYRWALVSGCALEGDSP